MRIQHNIAAINSHRNLGINNSFTNKNLEKLSSGYRINRAGDDAAGLAISEKMRGQIRGLSMAEQNTSNGISLIQTAEGALNETHAILQRMRELAVQSSNGTYDENVDRIQLNKEFQAVKSEIDRIAESTHYNGIKLLNGAVGADGGKVSRGATAIATVASALGLTVSASAVGAATTELVDGKEYGFNFSLGLEKQDNGKFTLRASMVDADGSLRELIIKDYDDSATSGSITNGSISLAAKKLTFQDVNGVKVDVDIATLASLKAGSVNNYGAYYKGDTSGAAVVAANKLDNAYGATGKPLVFQIGANGGDDQRVGLSVFDMSSTAIGYTAGEWLADADISNIENANKAIEIITNASNQVSGQRAGLGALQNRLEHTMNNLGVTKENLTAAESVIRDVDMAKEMMEFTKNQILVQASQAMLAQANQLPQGVLNLLR